MCSWCLLWKHNLYFIPFHTTIALISSRHDIENNFAVNRMAMIKDGSEWDYSDLVISITKELIRCEVLSWISFVSDKIESSSQVKPFDSSNHKNKHTNNLLMHDWRLKISNYNDLSKATNSAVMWLRCDLISRFLLRTQIIENWDQEQVW